MTRLLGTTGLLCFLFYLSSLINAKFVNYIEILMSRIYYSKSTYLIIFGFF